jgi:adenosylcobinamide-GDP ribazoletransferase
VTDVRVRLSPTRPWTELRALVAALAFLTRLPVGRWVVVTPADVARAGPAFPLVGAGIGAVVGVTAAGLTRPLSPLLGVVLAVAVGTLLTGALHLDALADTADALSAPSHAQALEIMRDPAIGAYGAVAIALDLLVRTGALLALVNHQGFVGVVVAAAALSRLMPVLLAASLPYARAGGGVGASLTQGGRLRAAAAAAVAVVIALAVSGINGAALAACAGALTVLLGFMFRRWLGGVTGDTLGAAVELTELSVLVVAVAMRGAA